MKRLLACVASALLLFGGSASAQKTKAALGSETATSFPDNVIGAITPAVARAYFLDIIPSWQQFPAVNAQIGATYTFVVNDYGQLVTFNNSSPVAVALPQAIGSFATWNTFVSNLGSGLVTITPTGSTINGLSTLTLKTGQSAQIISDGINYQIVLSGTAVLGAIPADNVIGNFSGSSAVPGSVTLPSCSAATSALLYSVSTHLFSCATLGLSSLSAISADNVVGNFSGSSAAPSSQTLSSCSTLSSALTYNTSTHAFGCNSIAGATTTVVAPQGRLTLALNTPVMVSSNTGATTLRYDCYGGNGVFYYTGSADAIDTIASCEVTDALVSAASAGQVVSNNVYDVWWVHGGANRICLAMSASAGGGGGWSSDTAGSNTARGTGYSQLDNTTRPYITNANSITNCFNGATNYGPVSANQGTYLGTVCSDAGANGRISYTFGGASSGGTAARLCVWNQYNRVMVGTNVQDSGSDYSYVTAATRAARASAGNRITYVLGQAEDGIAVGYNAVFQAANVVGAFANGCIGVDTTTACSSSYIYASNNVAASAIELGGGINQSVSPVTGLHFLSANETGDGSNGNIFDFTSSNILTAQLRM